MTLDAMQKAVRVLIPHAEAEGLDRFRMYHTSKFGWVLRWRRAVETGSVSEAAHSLDELDKWFKARGLVPKLREPVPVPSSN